MRRYINIILLFFIVLDVKGQQNNVLTALKRHDVDTNVLNNQAKESTNSLAFDLKQTTQTSSGSKIELASYDISKAAGSRWILQSVNGKQPSSGQIKGFLKAHREDIPIPTVDKNSYRIVSDKDSLLIIEFNYDEQKLKEENLFMRDCKGQLYINTKTKLLEKQLIQNSVPLKVKGIKIAKLLTTTQYSYNQNFHSYLPVRESTIMVIQLLGLTTDSEIISEYSNFRAP